MKRINYQVGHVRVESESDGTVRFVTYPKGDYTKEIILHSHITDLYSLMQGLRQSLKKTRSWLNKLEGRVTTAIAHGAPGDET